MARVNTSPPRFTETTHEGAPAARISPLLQLRRSVLSCLLWEDEFYEDGRSITQRITELVGQVPAERVAALAVEARSEGNLRHVPLFLARALAQTSGGKIVGDTIASVIQRADELGEFLALYWKDGKKPLDHQVRRGLGLALRKFDEYQLAKYDRDSAVKLRDVLRIVRPKPSSDEQSALWKRAVARELATPDTWETQLSGGADKKDTFERLIREGKLGYLALLRNLRNMVQADCDLGLIREAILARKNGAHRVLPFRFIAAARAVPQLEPELDKALVAGITQQEAWAGLTVVMVDVSSSMHAKLSAKSDLSRMDAAAALGAMIPGDVRVFSFSNALVEVPPRRGMAGVDAVIKSQVHSGTQLMESVRHVNDRVKYDRIIVISDEQAAADAGRMPAPKGRGYVINVASAKNGVGYGPWTHIDGFSESVLRYITAVERESLD